jgi:hypothetical protein
MFVRKNERGSIVLEKDGLGLGAQISDLGQLRVTIGHAKLQDVHGQVAPLGLEERERRAGRHRVTGA